MVRKLLSRVSRLSPPGRTCRISASGTQSVGVITWNVPVNLAWATPMIVKGWPFSTTDRPTMFSSPPN